MGVQINIYIHIYAAYMQLNCIQFCSPEASRNLQIGILSRPDYNSATIDSSEMCYNK